MANKRITDLTALTNVEIDDVVAIVDVSDTSGGANGTTKKATVDKLLRSKIRYAHSFGTGVKNSNLVYLAQSGTVGSTLITNKYVHLIAPHDSGTIVKVKIECGDTVAAGSTVVGIHVNENVTATEAVTVNMATAGTVYDFDFSTNTFSEGDIISISFDPTNNCGAISGVIITEYTL